MKNKGQLCSICNRPISKGWKNWETDEIICEECYKETPFGKIRFKLNSSIKIGD